MSLSHKGSIAKFQYAVRKLLRRWNTVNFTRLIVRILEKKALISQFLQKQRKTLAPLIIRRNLITTSQSFRTRSRFSLRSPLYFLEIDNLLQEDDSRWAGERAGWNLYRSIYTPMERFCNLIRCHGYLTRQLSSSLLVSRSFRHS